MPTVIKRCISLLLILMLMVSLISSVYAAETAVEADPAASTEPAEETMNRESEENIIPPPDETEPPVTEESGTEPPELDIIDDSEPPVMLLIDGEVALASISDCQATTWATIWVNTDEYSPIVGKTNRFIYYEFAGKSRNRNNVGLNFFLCHRHCFAVHEPGKETAVSFAPFFANLVSFCSQPRFHILGACGGDSYYALYECQNRQIYTVETRRPVKISCRIQPNIDNL